MNLLSHAVIYRGIVYYNTIVSLDGTEVRLIPYREECEATSFVNGVLLFMMVQGNTDGCAEALDDILSECDGLDEVIDRVRPLSEMQPSEVGNRSLTLFSLWPGVRIMAERIDAVVCR